MGDNLNFQDLFKKSVLHLEAFRDISYIDLFLGLISSFAIGMFIFWIYKKPSEASCIATTITCPSS
ncbi:hypothetical protein CM49_05783 [Paenibacillus sp. P1XP2]|nr:hypothetical protein CM49_05783 [Paenibacillus sp. P1XP2]